ncbi:hypothetical protein L2E82_30763 [Cichorium intybus]|uniref:Uncharacterized protein n=1 Tax=Cichorium intybus TaxID=13427 RepID=A0ACB9D1F9_CICIN|nr:hypothetical protein L2E82_30763 [Cichorium intybus]
MKKLHQNFEHVDDKDKKISPILESAADLHDDDGPDGSDMAMIALGMCWIPGILMTMENEWAAVGSMVIDVVGGIVGGATSSVREGAHPTVLIDASSKGDGNEGSIVDPHMSFLSNIGESPNSHSFLDDSKTMGCWRDAPGTFCHVIIGDAVNTATPSPRHSHHCAF